MNSKAAMNVHFLNGELTEWFMVPSWKGGGLLAPQVRILYSPLGVLFFVNYQTIYL